jgi:hypothetical protein
MGVTFARVPHGLDRFFEVVEVLDGVHGAVRDPLEKRRPLSESPTWITPIEPVFMELSRVVLH